MSNKSAQEARYHDAANYTCYLILLWPMVIPTHIAEKAWYHHSSDVKETRRFYTETLLHTEAFTHRRFYTEKLLHTEAFTHRGFYIQTLLHTDSFTHRRFYTQTHLHTDHFTHRHFYTPSKSPTVSRCSKNACRTISTEERCRQHCFKCISVST